MDEVIHDHERRKIMNMIENVKINLLSNPKGQVKAFARLDYYGLTLSQIKVVERKDGSGFFVSGPQEKGKDGKYYSIFYDAKSSYDSNTHTRTAGPAEQAIEKAVLDAYFKATASAAASQPAPQDDGMYDWE